MTPQRLAWWSRVLRVKTPIADESDLRTRLGAMALIIFMLIALVPLVLVLAAFVVAVVHDVGAWAANTSPSPLEARVRTLEQQVAAMRDGGRL